MTVYHETEEQAKKMLALLDEENTIKDINIENNKE